MPISRLPDSGHGPCITEDDVRRVVDAFYDVAAEDEVLGPIFQQYVHNWPDHMVRLYNFWSAVILQTGRYAGRPFEAHAQISQLRPEHFDRWLLLWEQTVAKTITPPLQGAFTNPARRMASSMMGRLFN
ncbi:MAG: group III truncated hemoglobin [Phycisphaerales bacterium]|nr:group III truncated hemoglobin [Phycisphaerales bacterium]